MNLVLEKAQETRTVKEFKDTLALFYPGSSLPYAMRAPLDSLSPPKESQNAEVIFEDRNLRISLSENRIYCIFGHSAVITAQSREVASKVAGAVKNYFKEADRILSAPNDHTAVCDLIAKTAEWCGCLTDINLPENTEISVSNSERRSKDHSAIAAIVAICLIYRRMSALRGFNFRLMFHEGLPSLAFSAKILGEGIESIKDLPEYPALEDLDSRGEVTVYSRLVKLASEDNEELYRLTLVLTLRADDPSGILRAPEWKLKTRASLDEIDLDIPGRF